MNAPEPRFDWTNANQRLLAAEFARLKALLRREPADRAHEEVDVCRACLAAPAAIDLLSERFGLSDFERDLLLLAAGVEMDSELAQSCAAYSGDARRAFATFGLALAVLPKPHWSALGASAVLRHFSLLELADDAALTSARLRIDERVLHYLAGLNYLDPRLQPLLWPVEAPVAMADGQAALAQAISDALEQAGRDLPVVQLWGDDARGKRDVSARFAAHAGLRLFALSAEDIPANAQESDSLSTLWQRESGLLGAALLIECREAPGPAARRFMERLGGLLLVSSREPTALSRESLQFRVDRPDRTDQRRLWQRAVGEGVDASLLDALAAEFRLSTEDLLRAGRSVARDPALLANAGTALWEICRGAEGARLTGLAQRIEAQSGWEDLVLPEPQKAMLRQIALHLRHRLTVHERWGFAAKSARGLGLSVLFAGESGTGKTMAAEVLANELHLALYRIDLSAVVSKYIGETEKNLARVFDAAENSGAILLFDEADALFGKRSEVRDSHDRYANIEVSYLLQRMEAYRGLAILTTNQKSALDGAFQRRLRFVVQFPFPDLAEREAIWRRVFPQDTPVGAINPAQLARLHMSGGQIRNIALNAAFYAAETGEPIGMAHILCAAHGEAAKRERPLAEAETRGWA